jgi:hypothetical protein
MMHLTYHRIHPHNLQPRIIEYLSGLHPCKYETKNPKCIIAAMHIWKPKIDQQVAWEYEMV